MDKVKIGVLGAGRGASLAAAMVQAPSAELTALCDPDADRLQQAVEKTGVTRTCDTYEALLDSDVDAVVVATPMPLHVEHSIQALRAGKHVLSEVTAATTIDQCWELVEAVRSTGMKYMLAENYCYIRPWSVVRGMVDAGVLGELYYGEADQIQDFKGGFPHPDTGYNWRTSELAMRRGHQYITHNLGPLYVVFKERMTSVVCLGSGQHKVPWAKADDTCIVLCRTETGKLLRIRLDFFSTRPSNYTYMGVQGTKGCYEASQGPTDFHKVYVEGRCEPGQWRDLSEFEQYLPDYWQRVPAESQSAGYAGGDGVMIEEFARAILTNTDPPVNVIDAVNMTAPGILSEQSAEQGGKPIDVPAFE